MTQTDAYLDAAAEQAVTLDALVESHKVAVSDIWLDCMQNPERRSEAIGDTMLSRLEENTAALHGEEYAEMYWGPISEFFDLSIDEIQDIPKPLRDNAWATGRAFVSSVCFQQGFVESGLALECMKHGYDSAKALESMWGAMSSEQQKKAAVENDKKSRIKEKKKNAKS